MSSYVFFQFRNDTGPTKIAIDGTGITVFELARAIIKTVGQGDYDLHLYQDDKFKDKYTDDTALIPQFSITYAKRGAPVRKGGNVARYMSGHAPVTAKNAYRTEAGRGQSTAQASASIVKPLVMDPNMTEEERIAAMLKADAAHWDLQKQQMANAKPVYNSRSKGGRPHNVPDHPPPSGYICYRCHEKGHWIQACPTNDDPTFEAKIKIKRTTGIPNSFLKVVDKPVAKVNDGLTDDRQPSGIMMNAQGQYVIAEPDKAVWEKYQAKFKDSEERTAAAKAAAEKARKERQELGVECPIHNELLRNSVKTSCCGKTYCKECIENKLLDDNLVCPNCDAESSIENLEADEEAAAKVKTYEEDLRKAKEASDSPKPAPVEAASTGSAEGKTSTPKSPAGSTASSSPTLASVSSTKKRPAEEELKNARIPTGPAAMRKSTSQQGCMPPIPTSMEEFARQMDALAGTTGPIPQVPFMPNMPMSGLPFPNAMGMPFNPMMMGGMPNGMINPMMPNGNWAGNMGGFVPQNAMFNNLNNNNNFNQGMYGNQGGYGQQGNWSGNQGQGQGQGQGQRQNWQGNQGGLRRGTGNMQNGNTGFSNQQGTVFCQPLPDEEDSAYFRRPVNPHRYQNRQRRIRPHDYTELGQ